MSSDDQKTRSKKPINPIVWVGLAIIGLLIISSLSRSPSKDTSAPISASSDTSSSSTTASVSPDAPSEPPPPASDWYQFEREDELRSTTDRFATVTSQNSARFDFPYCCDSKLKITVRETKQYGQDVIFQISDGQFVCGLYDCKGMISIDGKPETLSLNTSADRDSKTLFAKYPAAIIRKLKSSENVIVEVPFYQEGNRQFHFETGGLEW